MKKMNYEAPLLELELICVEAGFATSGDDSLFEDPTIKDEQEW